MYKNFWSRCSHIDPYLHGPPRSLSLSVNVVPPADVSFPWRGAEAMAGRVFIAKWSGLFRLWISSSVAASHSHSAHVSHPRVLLQRTAESEEGRHCRSSTTSRRMIFRCCRPSPGCLATLPLQNRSLSSGPCMRGNQLPIICFT